MNCRIGIRPIIDARCNGVREMLEEQTRNMAENAKRLIGENVRYSDGTPVECLIAETTIGGGAEAARCAELFRKNEVTATLSVTPSWCYCTETMDLDPTTVKAVWGFNGTERPGAVYLAAVMAAHAQRGLPAFAIYGEDVCDADSDGMTQDVREKILCFARAAVAVGQMRNRAYVGVGGVCMGIAGSDCDASFFQNYLGMRAEWADMSEVSRRIELGIYDHAEFERALAWVKANCRKGDDNNANPYSDADKEGQWETNVKMTLILSDIMYGNPVLAEMGFREEALGKNAILGGFQGQRNWTDFRPNADFCEAILSSGFDWNGKREQKVLATENDGLNGVSMLFAKLLTHRPGIFADVRTYWSPDAVERVSGWKPEGTAKDGFIHLINSGAAALEGTGACTDDAGEHIMKRWYDLTDEDIRKIMGAVRWAPANRSYFRGGGFSSQFSTQGVMPVTMIRINLVKGLGPMLQLAEGYTAELPEEVNEILLNRTDPTWPSTWFAPRLDPEKPAFSSVYSVMSNWGANHGAFVYGHVGRDLIALAAMLRIPVAMHNVSKFDVFRPQAFSAFGTENSESSDYRACAAYGPLYR